MRLFILLAALPWLPAMSATQDSLTPLMLYNGTWQVSHAGGAKPDLLVNQCAKTGHFVTCDQSVNGGPSALLVFIPRTDKPGQYYTQNIRPEGRATSRGDLEISGDVWTFLSNWDNSGHTIYYRTVNTFVSRSHIKYEQAESSDGKDWKVTASGEETRVMGKR
jgi:hypothetical protein